MTLSGVTRIRTRVAQLKLSFYNKLKTFDDGLYLKALMRESFKPDRRSGLGHDIMKIYDEFMGFPKFQEEMEDFLDVNHVNDNYKMFNKSIKSMLEEIDFEYCIEKMAHSADVRGGGSGQAGKSYAYLSKEIYPSLCPLLLFRPRHRRERTIFLRTLSGCDFLTPHSFKNLPKCKLCGRNGVGWKHLLFNCPKRDSHFVNDLRERLEQFENQPGQKVAQNCLELLNRLANNNAFDDLLKFAFGLCCTDTTGDICALRSKNVLPAIMEVAAKHLADVHSEWFIDL